MRIAKFNSEAEKSAVITAFQNYLPTWIGGNDIVKPGTIRWAPDDSPTYPSINEKINGTEKSGGQHCLHLNKYAPNSDYVNEYSANCSDTKYFICFK